MDVVANDPRYKKPFSGWHASIADPDCNAAPEVREKHRKSRDGVTGAETMTAALKNYRELDSSEGRTLDVLVTDCLLETLAEGIYTPDNRSRQRIE